MRATSASGLVTFAISLVGAAAQNTATSTSAVEAAAATALTLSPTSSVNGKAFDRIAIFWLENTDADEAYADRKLHRSNLSLFTWTLTGAANLKYLQSKGITLTNYNAVTHPSEPNYIASSSGDYYGLGTANLSM